ARAARSRGSPGSGGCERRRWRRRSSGSAGCRWRGRSSGPARRSRPGRSLAGRGRRRHGRRHAPERQSQFRSVLQCRRVREQRGERAAGDAGRGDPVEALRAPLGHAGERTLLRLLRSNQRRGHRSDLQRRRLGDLLLGPHALGRGERGGSRRDPRLPERESFESRDGLDGGPHPVGESTDLRRAALRAAGHALDKRGALADSRPAMDLRYGPEYESFRAELRAFLAAHRSAPPAAVGALGWLPDTKLAPWQRLLIEHGYAARTIPREYGGGGFAADPLIAAIIAERSRAAGVPGRASAQGIDMLVPTLLEHGTEEQKRRWIPPTVRAELIWCQGYSEPGAGSDLASLTTVGRIYGDTIVVNGQKIWTSTAHVARMMFGLVRTEPEANKHAGISYLLIPMDTPGIEER